jgi:hypothetical protein
VFCVVLKNFLFSKYNHFITPALIVSTQSDLAQKALSLSGNRKLTYTITLKSLLQISKQVGDQNTASTEDLIPAQIIRRLIAELIINAGNYKIPAHEDAEFKKLVLDGRYRIFPCITISYIRKATNK